MSLNNVLDTIAATQSGAWTLTANAGTGFPAVATAGSAVPATGLMAYGSDGTNARAIKTDATGIVSVSFTSGSVTADTELPAAAAVADAFANPTTTNIMSMSMGWNGTTWDRLKSDTANGLDVDVTRVSGTVTVDSELPAADALADTTANPTTTSVGALALLYNGATWDRMRGDSTNGLDVDVTRVSGTVTISGTVTANAGTGFPAVATAGSAHITTGLQGMLSDGTNAVRVRGTTTGATWVTGEPIATLTQVTISVGATATLILADNASRKGFIICNQGSTQDIYFGNASVVSGASAIANGGLRISKNGGALTSTQMSGYTGPVYGITASSTAVVGAIEW